MKSENSGWNREMYIKNVHEYSFFFSISIRDLLERKTLVEMLHVIVNTFYSLSKFFVLAIVSLVSSY